jgi:hypothetical protein
VVFHGWFSSGNLTLGIDISPFLKELPATVALLNPTTGSSCPLLPLDLGAGVWTQRLESAGCNSYLLYQTPFAAAVSNGQCWNILDASTENGTRYSITFNNYQTTAEVFQTGLATFITQSGRGTAQTEEPLTTISRQFRRDYTISVATSFTATSQVSDANGIVFLSALSRRIVSLSLAFLSVLSLVCLLTQLGSVSALHSVRGQLHDLPRSHRS